MQRFNKQMELEKDHIRLFCLSQVSRLKEMPFWIKNRILAEFNELVTAGDAEAYQLRKKEATENLRPDQKMTYSKRQKSPCTK